MKYIQKTGFENLLRGGIGLYNRYGDISKFITDMEQLCVADDGYVYISRQEDYEIAVDMCASQARWGFYGLIIHRVWRLTVDMLVIS